jgi:peroxiredoxin Q/BCP
MTPAEKEKFVMKLKTGQKAPDFVLADQHGTTHKLSDYHGRWVLIYFYPRDNTPGCTKEACAIRDRFPDFWKLKAAVLGISVDSVKSHEKFAQKYELPFTLLSDEKKDVVKRYDVWGKKKFMGREFMGTLRTSFLLAPDGRIAKIYDKVKPADHAAEVLRDLSALMG